MSAACRFTKGQKVVVDATLIVTFVKELDGFRCVVETGSGSMVISQERLTLEREEIDE